MRIEVLPLAGAALLHGDVHRDDRGCFRRVLDVPALAGQGLDTAIVQISVATNHEAGTIRGLHYQAEPHSETKTLWCSAGSVYDVLVDVRPLSPTYGHIWSTTLSAHAPVALSVPPGIAHGYQTLEPDSGMTYVISSAYVAASARCLRWDDPQLAIGWPLPVSKISDRDREAPTWPPSP